MNNWTYLRRLKLFIIQQTETNVCNTPVSQLRCQQINNTLSYLNSGMDHTVKMLIKLQKQAALNDQLSKKNG